MPSVYYNRLKQDSLTGQANLSEGQEDLKVMLLMTNTNAGTLKDADLLADLILDEFDGAGYVPGGEACQNQLVVRDDVNDWSKLTFDDVSWADLQDGTRQIAGVLLYEDAGNRLRAYYEFPAPINPGGGPFILTVHADGFLNKQDK